MSSVAKLELIGFSFKVSKRSEYNENLIKQLFHSRLSDMRVVMGWL